MSHEDVEIARLQARIVALQDALKPFAEVALAIKETEFFKHDDPRKPSLDTPVSMLVQKLGDSITIAVLFEASAALAHSKQRT
jgi:hypothetical protein